MRWGSLLTRSSSEAASSWEQVCRALLRSHTSSEVIDFCRTWGKASVSLRTSFLSCHPSPCPSFSSTYPQDLLPCGSMQPLPFPPPHSCPCSLQMFLPPKPGAVACQGWLLPFPLQGPFLCPFLSSQRAGISAGDSSPADHPLIRQISVPAILRHHAFSLAPHVLTWTMFWKKSQLGSVSSRTTMSRPRAFNDVC